MVATTVTIMSLAKQRATFASKVATAAPKVWAKQHGNTAITSGVTIDHSHCAGLLKGMADVTN